VAPICPTGDGFAHVVGARRCLARPRRTARQCTVADRSRTTRTADQPRGPLHDRPAVNGRAQSPSRLKPADPHSASTQPIDPRACTSSSPLQGACGLSPGLQPRAFAADRPVSDARGTTAPFGVDRPALPGRRVRNRLTPTRAARSPHHGAHVPDRGWVAPPCRGEALPRPPAPDGAAIRGDACARTWVAGAVRPAGPGGPDGSGSA
jgi:hypothetical protein